MEENKDIVEQPTLSAQVQKDEEDVGVSGTSGAGKDGSQFGKFSSAENLLDAYNNLQAEFTRKCQKLSEIEKKIADNSAQETSTEVDETKSDEPQFQKEDWSDKVTEFLSKNQHAQNFAKEISEEIINNKNIQNLPNALDLAWACVAAKKYRSPDEIATDDKFFEKYVYGNENVKQKVLEIYLNEQEKQKSPTVITSNISGAINMAAKKNPVNLNDAKKIVEKLFI